MFIPSKPHDTSIKYLSGLDPFNFHKFLFLVIVLPH